MSEIARTPEEVARLILANPGLPVIKPASDGCENPSDGYVLILDCAWAGEYWEYKGWFYDDRQDMMDEYEADGGAGEPDCLHGRCIWLEMGYFDPEEG